MTTKQNTEKLLKELEIDSEEINLDNEDIDSYFKAILNELISDKNISMKTEYNDDTEIMISSKFDFISKACNVPMYEKFLENLEKRKVSKKRKGRIEILLGLEKREQEIEARAMRDINRGL